MKEIMTTNLGSMTLNEIQANADEIIITKNVVKMKKRQENQIITVCLESYPNGQTITQNKFENSSNKRELEETIKQKLQEGKRQKDIAFELDVSQAFISNVKNGK